MEETLSGYQFINGLRRSLGIDATKISLRLPNGRDFSFTGNDADQSAAIDLEITNLSVRIGGEKKFTACDFKGKGGSNMAWSPKESREAIRILVAPDSDGTDLPERIVRLNNELAKKYDMKIKEYAVKLKVLYQLGNQHEKKLEAAKKNNNKEQANINEDACLDYWQEYYDLRDLVKEYREKAKILRQWKVKNLELRMDINDRTSGKTHKAQYRIDATVMPLMNTEAPITVAAKFIAVFDYFKFTGRVLADGFLRGNIGTIGEHIIINDKNACAQASKPTIPSIKQVTASPAGKKIVQIYDDHYSIRFQKSVEYSNAICCVKDPSLNRELFTGAGMLQLILCELFLKNISVADLAKRKFRTNPDSKIWTTIAASDLELPSTETIAELCAKYKGDADFAKVTASLDNIKNIRASYEAQELRSPQIALFTDSLGNAAAVQTTVVNADMLIASPTTVVAVVGVADYDDQNVLFNTTESDGNNLFNAAPSDLTLYPLFVATPQIDGSSPIDLAPSDGGQACGTTARPQAKRRSPTQSLFSVDYSPDYPEQKRSGLTPLAVSV